MKAIMKASVWAPLWMMVTAGAAFAFEMTPATQAEIDKHKTVISGWATDPVIVSAVKAQNGKGSIPGMDNPKWKTIRRSDAVVKAFQDNPAGKMLSAKLAAGGGVYAEAFLNAAQGEKVAFVEKTTSYIHLGQPKFDVPFTTGKAWQGKPEFDESAQTYQLQISVPVLADGKSIGALVVGVSLAQLEKAGKK
jgi:hypothetical protein